MTTIAGHHVEKQEESSGAPARRGTQGTTPLSSKNTGDSAGHHGQWLPGEPAGQLSERARRLQDDADLEATPTTMAHAARQRIPGAAAPVSVAQKHRTTSSLAPSSGLPRDVDALPGPPGRARAWMRPAGSGSRGRRILGSSPVVGLRPGRRRGREDVPAVLPAAGGGGADVLGALDVYGADHDALEEDFEEIGALVAHAAVAFAEAKQIRGAQETVATRNGPIGPAKGHLVERFKP